MLLPTLVLILPGRPILMRPFRHADACTSNAYVTATINGIFKISQPVTFVGLQGLTLIGNCFIYPMYTSGTHVLGFKNGAGLRIYGRVEASGVNLLGIKSACKLWSDGSGISFSYLYGLIGSYALVGIQFGDLAYPGALVSEMSLMGGHTLVLHVLLRLLVLNVTLILLASMRYLVQQEISSL